MYYNKQTIIYSNGQFINAGDSKADFYSQTLHYGYGAFEGIRSYTSDNGEVQIFKATEHFERLQRSANALHMPYPYHNNELIAASYELLRLNHLQDAYIRPLIYAPSNMGFSVNKQSNILIAAWEMPAFLGQNLLKVCTSSHCRPHPKSVMLHVKATGHYVNSIIASIEAREAGYDEGLLSDLDGYVAEGPGSNVFYEKDGTLFTPPVENIFPGITRSTVIELCSNLNIPVVEKKFTIKEMQSGDAAFFCGTAVEIVGIGSIDGIQFGKEWNESIGKKIRDAYNVLVRQNVLVDFMI